MIENGQYRFYTCAKDYCYIDKYAFDTEALLISGNGAYVGYIHYYKGKFNAYQRTYVLDQFTENIQYIKVYLDEFLSKRINSEKKEGNTPYIVLSTLSDMTIKLTNSKHEDNVINTFNNINTKINKEELKLNKIIELKKGLMQNMFV
jgi:putative type I restriction enzyme specificity protein